MSDATRNETPRDLVPGFAKMVMEARRERQWSQRELARQANISPMCISDLEAEKRSTSLRVAMLIAQALGLKVLLSDPATVRAKKKS